MQKLISGDPNKSRGLEAFQKQFISNGAVVRHLKLDLLLNLCVGAFLNDDFSLRF